MFVKRLNFEALSVRSNCNNSIPLVGDTHFYFKTVVVSQRKKINKKSFYVKVSEKSRNKESLQRDCADIFEIEQV